MKRSVLIALLMAFAMIIAACSSSSDDTTTTAAGGDDGAETTTTADSGDAVMQRDFRFVVVSHGQASDPFWSVAQNGVNDAGADMGVTVEYQAYQTYDMVEMSNIINAAVASEPDGLVVTIPDADALGEGRGCRRHPGDLDELRQRRVRRTRCSCARRPDRVRGRPDRRAGVRG